MKAKYVQEGTLIDYVPSTNVAAGDVVIAGELVGVAPLDIAAGEKGVIITAGVFDVAKSTAAFAVGDKVYWNADECVATKVDTDKLLGFAADVAAAGTGVVRVKIGK